MDSTHPVPTAVLVTNQDEEDEEDEGEEGEMFQRLMTMITSLQKMNHDLMAIIRRQQDFIDRLLLERQQQLSPRYTTNHYTYQHPHHPPERQRNVSRHSPHRSRSPRSPHATQCDDTAVA